MVKGPLEDCDVLRKPPGNGLVLRHHQEFPLIPDGYEGAAVFAGFYGKLVCVGEAGILAEGIGRYGAGLIGDGVFPRRGVSHSQALRVEGQRVPDLVGLAHGHGVRSHRQLPVKAGHRDLEGGGLISLQQIVFHAVHLHVIIIRAAPDDSRPDFTVLHADGRRRLDGRAAGAALHDHFRRIAPVL